MTMQTFEMCYFSIALATKKTGFAIQASVHVKLKAK